jgi:hypothetical protein
MKAMLMDKGGQWYSRAFFVSSSVELLKNESDVEVDSRLRMSSSHRSEIVLRHQADNHAFRFKRADYLFWRNLLTWKSKPGLLVH